MEMSRAAWDPATGAPTISDVAAFSGALVVKGAAQVSGIEKFTSLRGLEIIGGDIHDLGPLVNLRSLRALKIVCAKLRDLSPLAALTELEDLEINFTFVEDLSPIEGLRNLGWLKLFGNPLDAKSFHEVIERKRTTELARWGRPCIVEASGEDEWKLCRKLFETGVGLSWGRIPTIGYMLVRPGRGSAMPIEFLQLPPTAITTILAAPDPTQAPAVKNVGTLIQDSDEKSDERFGVLWQAGRPPDAERWLQAATWLPDDERQRYLRFVARFPDETFYRDHDTRIRWEVAKNNTPLPAWYVQLRTEALTFVRPHAQRSVDIRVAFDRRAPTRSGGWYDLSSGFRNRDVRELFHDKLGLYPIAEINELSDLGHSTLAINLRDPNDRAIYEVDPEYAYAYVDEGGAAVTPVFASYGALMDRITALRAQALENNGAITEARAADVAKA
jgi:hypothetical protein